MEQDYKYMDSLFLEETKRLDARSVCSDIPLSVEEVADGVILPCKTVDGKKRAGVLDKNGEYVSLSAFEALSPVDCWGGGYEVSDVKKMDERVVYFGRFWRHWGHFLMDLIPRLWYVVEREPAIKIAYDGAEDMQGVYLEFLELLGISKGQLIRVDEPTAFSSVVVPECSHKPGILCHASYKRLFDVAAESALKDFSEGEKYRDKNIYLTRTGLKKRIPLEVGEKQLEGIFEKNGYLVVSPEKYSLREQIAMLRLGREICCVSGTLPHNMMFAKDGAGLIMLRKSNKPVYRQWDVNQVRELLVTTVDAHISLFAVGAAGPFILDVNENVRRFFSDRRFVYKHHAVLQFFRRKGKLLWYLPVYFARNRGKNPQVPLFDGEQFTTTKTAKKELFGFYRKRI